jgi:hypothetical protein
MHDEHLTVRRLLNVEFDEVRVLLRCQPKRGEACSRARLRMRRDGR